MSDVEERLDELEAHVENLEEFALTEGSMEMAALKQLVWGLADGDAEDYDHIVAGVHSALDTVERMDERIDELEAENERLRSRLDKLGDIGQEKTNKEQKIAAIVTYAENERRSDQSAVSVKPRTIKGLVGVSRRYANDLIDDMVNGDGENGTVGPDGYDWAHDSRDLPRHLEQDTPDKAVVVDFEGVHGDPVPVKEFTTASAGMGVAD